jgi:hypothetical protein
VFGKAKMRLVKSLKPYIFTPANRQTNKPTAGLPEVGDERDQRESHHVDQGGFVPHPVRVAHSHLRVRKPIDESPFEPARKTVLASHTFSACLRLFARGKKKEFVSPITIDRLQQRQVARARVTRCLGVGFVCRILSEIGSGSKQTCRFAKEDAVHWTVA